MKKIVTSAVIGLFAAQIAIGGLQWGSGSNVITDFNGDPVPTIDGFTADPTEGAFAQLIRILTGTDPYGFVNSGSGINTTHEQVVDTMYANVWDIDPAPGTFNFGPEILQGSQYDGTYYVRVFDSPQATVGDWNLGNDAPIPSGAQYYFQSETYSYTHDELSPSTYNFGAGQTLNLVPEPGTMMLFVGGLVGMWALRRKRLA